MSMNNNSNQPHQLKRLRLSRACDRCRKRKIKCDEGHPCQSCFLAKAECTFNVEPTKAPPRKKNVAELEARMSALEKVIEAFPPSISQAALSKLDFALSNTSEGSKKRSSSGESKRRSSYNSMPRSSINNNSMAFSNSFNDNNDLSEHLSSLTISPSYLYFDHEGNPAWTGSTSGLPLIDMLNNKLAPKRGRSFDRSSVDSLSPKSSIQFDDQSSVEEVYFPGRMPQQIGLEPSFIWNKVISVIPLDLMNSLIRTYLATTHLLWPFLHIPTFLKDYATPSSWGEPGFAALVVAICTLASRHVDDPRARSDPNDPASSGRHYFKLLSELHDLPHRQSGNVYYIQSIFLAAIYSIGSGKLAKAFALFAESITLCIDAGLHRSLDHYDLTDEVWSEIRKRTFWAIYCWDKQAAAAFGRPPMIRLRDCDVSEPLDIDDHYLSDDINLKSFQPPNLNSRLKPFIHTIRLHVVLEHVLDGCNPPAVFPSSTFLTKAAAVGQGQALEIAEELLSEWKEELPPYLKYTHETATSDDAFRLTQAERIHCLEQLTCMLVYRHRFSTSSIAAEQLSELDQVDESGIDASRKHYQYLAQQSALTIIAAHSHIARRKLLTHYGVHVIHQLTQAGRTLVAVVLQCRRTDERSTMSVSLEGLRVAVSLLRQFAVRYGCGARSSDVLVEFCRVCQIPVDDNAHLPSIGHAWLRPVPLKSETEARRRRNSKTVIHNSTSIENELINHNNNAFENNLKTEPKDETLYNLINSSNGPISNQLNNSFETMLKTEPEDEALYSLMNSANEPISNIDANESQTSYQINEFSNLSPQLSTNNVKFNPNSAADILELLNKGKFDVETLFDGNSIPGRAPDDSNFGLLAPPGAENFGNNNEFVPKFN